MKQKVYDALRTVQLIIPAVVALYAALAEIWGWPYSSAIAGTGAAVETFISAILMIASKKFFKDKVIINEDGTVEG